MTSPIASSTEAGAFARPLRTAGAFTRFIRHPLTRIGLPLLILLVIFAVFSHLLSRGPEHNPEHIYPDGLDSLGVPHSPGGGFLLGADTLGRDVWTRLLFGARLSLSIALCAMLTSTVIGTTVGLLAGYFGGWVDRTLTRITEIVASLPTILLAITLTLVLPETWRDVRPFSDLNLDPRLVVAIGLVTWTGISRAVRGQVLSLKEREFVEAARALGQSNTRILVRHILPNVLPTVITLAVLATASNILLEAGLSYLGLGAPEKPSWGSIIAEGQPYFSTAPWITLSAGAAIILAVAAFNLLGNALTESLETRR
ncbi:ABC transporter permease [bacterium]|nr:MAG: ABC transporter permease [bacterium]